MIHTINEVVNIEVLAVHNWKDKLENSISQVKNLPSSFYIGDGWILKHTCKKCNQAIDLGEDLAHIVVKKYLSTACFKNASLLDNLGSLFDLTLNKGKKENNAETHHYYNLIGEHKSIALFVYYRCPYCLENYVSVLCYVTNDDEYHPEPSKVYIERILQVALDHVSFTQELAK